MNEIIELNIESLISDLALILVLGAVAAILFKKLKQPVVLGYIVAGFVASPHFSFLPTVAQHANIEFWAQIGIIVLLFSLGLEFSFKKLLNVGGSAIVTTTIIVLGMMGTGFFVGEMLGFSAVNSLFLGGMISMSSTTIIIKALDDLGMRQRRFVPQVMVVLIVEDLFAVLLMVILSSVAINKTVEGKALLQSVLQLVFFLVILFVVGVAVLPTLFKKYHRFITSELMLIISMGLCFLTAILSVKSGFSMALGAFIIGSILAGTTEAERIEHIITPVKDLFGAVFFISVGMMVDPTIIVQYGGTIALLAVVVVVGMIVFGTFGMVASGQPLKLAMESGFCLTQIGEFSFIIASMGLTLHVLDASIYPIIVSVSVITTFFTPFFIKLALPCYNWLERILPKSWTRLLEGYSETASESERSQSGLIWGSIVRRFVTRLLVYVVVAVAIVLISHKYLIPFVSSNIHYPFSALISAAVTLLLLLPIMVGIIIPHVKASEREHLSSGGTISYVPLIVMIIVGMVISMMLCMAALYGIYHNTITLVVSVVIVLLVTLFLAPRLRRRMQELEHRFMSNINERENRRTGRGNNLVSDLHLAYMRVSYSCPFVGEKLKNADLRKHYGVNVVNIQRNSVIYPVPDGNTRIFPGDVLGVIGTEEQIQQMLPLVEAKDETSVSNVGEAKFIHFAISEQSPIVGKSLVDARIREDYGSHLVAVQRGDDDFINPTPEVVFQPGDILWIVGDPQKLTAIKK